MRNTSYEVYTVLASFKRNTIYIVSIFIHPGLLKKKLNIFSGNKNYNYFNV
ncbi:hypothetical protein Xmau_01482 [Xenorhabdus mauleonii]|uniref:Uncharacterized protein n=1 Tax=Xenorhabdus mauleonii TaxID=351675 RepID=A0A1I3PKQ4_9GAMM|nr:hypothetical protein Xmau_01482 [Xenorhabdus mauleonii]SFJ22072.1 hypothetical protein SAMN05421680_106179 [Xenorhabdus mauleonii]